MIENIPWSTASYWEAPTDARLGGKRRLREGLWHILCAGEDPAISSAPARGQIVCQAQL